MIFRGNQGKEKSFLGKWMGKGCQPGVACSPRHSERDCAYEGSPLKAGRRFGEEQVTLREYVPLDLPGPNPFLNQQILIYFTSVNVSSPWS